MHHLLNMSSHLSFIYLIATTTLVTLVSTSVPDMVDPLPFIGNTSFISTNDKSPTDEQSPSLSNVKTISEYVPTLTPKTQQKILNTPRQAVLFKVLNSDFRVRSDAPEQISYLVTSQDMSKLLVPRDLNTKLFELDPNNEEYHYEPSTLESSKVIAVSNNSKFTIRIEERQSDEIEVSKGMESGVHLFTCMYLDYSMKASGLFNQGDNEMEASFSPDSKWALIRSPLGPLSLWEAVDLPDKHDPSLVSICYESSAATIGDKMFAYVEGNQLYVNKLDTDLTPILKTKLQRTGRVHKMTIYNDKIGVIQGKYFTIYDLNGTIHTKNYAIDVDGREVMSFAFHDTHIALIGFDSRMHVYDFNRSSQGEHIHQDPSNIVLGKTRKFTAIKNIDNDSFEVLEYCPAEEVVYELCLCKHLILLESNYNDEEEGLEMNSLLPAVLWFIIGSYLPKPEILQQISGNIPNRSERALNGIQPGMEELLKERLGKIPPVITFNDHHAYYVDKHTTELQDTHSLFHFDSRTKSITSIGTIPITSTISTIHSSKDGHRFVLFSNDGTMYMTSKKGDFHQFTAPKCNSTTRVYLHPLQLLTFIYHDNVLYVFKDPSKPPLKVTLLPLLDNSIPKELDTMSIHFGSILPELFINNGTFKHRFTYTNVLPDA